MKHLHVAATLLLAFPLGHTLAHAAPRNSAANAKAAEEALADVISNKESWQTCMTETTLRMGQKNTEDASTVVRAAQARCLETNGQNLRMLPNVIMVHEIRSILAAGLVGPGVSNAQIRAKALAEVEQFKQQAADKAIAALLEERSRAK